MNIIGTGNTMRVSARSPLEQRQGRQSLRTVTLLSNLEQEQSKSD